MIAERDLLDAIELFEKKADSTNECQTLAAYYIINDHLFKKPSEEQHSRASAPVAETVIHTDCSDDFLRLIEGKPAADMWDLMSELMFAVRELQPNLYRTTIKEIKNI